MHPLFLVILLPALTLPGLGMCYLIYISADSERIREHIMDQGGQLISIKGDILKWSWLNETIGRDYYVKYIDLDGNKHTATCQTSRFVGVTWAEDQIVSKSPRQFPKDVIITTLCEENRRLRLENERLRRL